ncbi:Dps family protein [Tengunoibacter tsumagoiensis]|uniref:Ferritin/DPS domain-containing protein n=1 Tax=Tengunoibacter tsumagoiensis TaxID=2014871 RepID=A0A402A1X7_9CHLR|nr:DNA starvation/stationary phase protection protein [Tengunoibacter tsumagoiensis]GCE13066.1 hypothetical protein KTT_29250 [Tengunoibacter tsumagoiensis]
MTTKQKTQAQSSSSIKSFPVPPPLATVTDLTPEEVKHVTDVINPLIADAFALYTKTKNFHWHLEGSHFRDYHLLFDEHAAALLASIDTMAERVRRIGGTTIRSIGHISQLQTIQDNNADLVDPAEMVRQLLQDNTHMAQMLRAAGMICEDNHDYATSNELEVLLDETERRKWFLYEIVQGQDNAN